MTKEEIIALAIREAFLCGKEAGEESQRMWHSMQQKIDAAKQGKPDHDQHQYDGFLPQIELAKLKEENEKLGKILEEKDATITELRANLDERYEELMALDNDHTELLKLIKEKDATITELRNELKMFTENVKEEQSDCIQYSEGDKVLVSGKFFDDEANSFSGTISEILDDGVIVLITEPDSTYNGADFFITYNYITKR